MKKIEIRCSLVITDEEAPGNPEKWEMDQTIWCDTPVKTELLNSDFKSFFDIAINPNLTKEEKEKLMAPLAEF